MKSFFDELIPLNKNHQGAWRYWQRSLMVFNEKPNAFWYLSSGTDFFPVSYFSSIKEDALKANVFFYTDHSKTTYDNLLTHASADQSSPVFDVDETLVLKNAIPMVLKAMGIQVLFFVFHIRENPSADIPLFFLHTDNEDALRMFKSKAMSFKYICTVADGCRSLEASEKNPVCPMEKISDFKSVIPQGYWLSDHLPEVPQHCFKSIATVHGWGRYNLQDVTWMYKIDN